MDMNLVLLRDKQRSRLKCIKIENAYLNQILPATDLPARKIAIFFR